MRRCSRRDRETCSVLAHPRNIVNSQGQLATEDSPDTVGFYQPRGGTLKAHASCVAVAAAQPPKTPAPTTATSAVRLLPAEERIAGA